MMRYANANKAKTMKQNYWKRSARSVRKTKNTDKTPRDYGKSFQTLRASLTEYTKESVDHFQKIMKASGFKEEEFTVVTNEHRIESQARGCLTNAPVSLRLKNKRVVGTLQGYFKFLNWSAPGAVPNFECDVKGHVSGKVIRVNMEEVDLRVHTTIEEAFFEADTENGLDPTLEKRKRDEAFLTKFSKMQ